MNCVDARELIQLYMDDELSSREALDVQHHIDSCSACASLLHYFTRQDEALRLFAKTETPDYQQLREQIIKDIMKQPAPAPNRSWWLGLVQSPVFRRVAAVLVVAVVIGFFFLQSGTRVSKAYVDAVEDHSDHCTLAVLDSYRVTVRDPLELDKMTVRYSKLAKTPDLSAFGYGEARAVICTINSKKALHLIYQHPEQKPVSLFIRLHDQKMIEDDLTTLTQGEYKVSSLSKAGTDLFVVSQQSDAQTAAFARAIAEQLQQ
jgi:anti-sigma factor RsiW